MKVRRALGDITGGPSAYFGQWGAQAGTQFGYNLSNATISGLEVGKAFEYLGGTNMIMGLGKGIGSVIGMFVGEHYQMNLRIIYLELIHLPLIMSKIL